jgi:hypothetical protein
LKQFYNSYLHELISALLIIYLHRVKQSYFALIEEISNNIVHHLSAVLISGKKTVLNRDQLFRIRTLRFVQYQQGMEFLNSLWGLGTGEE